MSDISKRLDDMIEWIDGEAKVMPDSMIDLLEDSRNEITDLESRLAAAEAARDNLLSEAEKLRDDLLMRADVDSGGTKVVAAGFTRWLAFNEAIDQARGDGND